MFCCCGGVCCGRCVRVDGWHILLGTADARCEIVCSSQGGGGRVAACGTKNAIAYFVPLSGCRFGSICGIIHAH